MIKSPRFSVVIPTRDRPDTLRVTLATCLEQEFDDYEIIVCDNAGSVETRNVVEEVGSARLSYHRSERPLAMSANWELAVSKACGEYITVLGDDDALMPQALRELDRLIEAYDEPDAVHWRRAIYAWPTIGVASEADFLVLPLDRRLQVVRGVQLLRRAACYEMGVDMLPMIYSAVVRRDLVDRLRALAGSVFPTLYPDVFSGCAFAYLSERLVSLGVPMSVAGLSQHSNGVATLVNGGSDEIARDFRELNREAGLRPHDTVPDVGLWPVPFDDSFQHARDLLFPDEPTLILDRRRMVERYLEALPSDLPEQERIRSTVRTTVRDDADLLEWFDREAATVPAAGYRLKPERFGVVGDLLVVDTSLFGVVDVAAAARLATNLVGMPAGSLDYDVATDADTDDVRLPAPVHRTRLRRAVPRRARGLARRVRGALRGLSSKQSV